MYRVINATPHPVRVLTSLFNGTVSVSYYMRESPAFPAPIVQTDDGPAYAVTSGPAIGCTVGYEPTAEGLKECRDICDLLYQCQGVNQIVIASEISTHAYYNRVDDGVIDVLMGWPVIAQNALRLRPGDRWADKLAVRKNTEIAHFLGSGSAVV